MSASVDLPLHHKVQKFSSGTGSPGLSQKKGRKMVVGGFGAMMQNLCQCFDAVGWAAGRASGL